ncbi:unnamed protein product [Tetraodon nigroviridis]|uniref:(spotted green pufferfish) hypothetical protein n=1 Tax=Tetraodon nigroviridis TaxID=99883 RepID=Q4S341_TETNG|nr:unnamed protein product [Tetraodon nigroviridis]
MFTNLPVKVAVMLLILRTGAKAAPTERGFLRPRAHLGHSSASPEVSAALNPSQYLKNWILSSKPAADGTTATMHRWAAGTNSAGVRMGRARTRSDSASLGKQAQMLEMITALEELQRAVNSTLSSRITVMSRDSANPVVTGQNSKKSQTKKTKRVCFWKYCSQN